MNAGKNFAMIASMAVMLAGCATSPPDPIRAPAADVAAANIGPYPENYQQLIKDHMQKALKDPESARYHFSSPPERRGTTRYRTSDVHRYYWHVDYAVNAKNSYGAYAGEDQYFAEIVDGRLIKVANVSKASRDLDRSLRRY